VINAGSERVRFLSPVPSGSRIRAAGVLDAAERVPAGVRSRIRVTVELEGSDKPALVAETLLIFVPEDVAEERPHEEGS
jgi:acyl dehydratase